MPKKFTTCPNCGALIHHVCPECLYQHGELRDTEPPPEDCVTRFRRHIGARIAEGFSLIAAAGDA